MKKTNLNKTTTMKGAPSWDKAKSLATRVVNPKPAPKPKKGGR